MPLLDLVRQVKSILPQRFGGTGNPSGWGSGIVVPYLNVFGASLAIGTIVQQAGKGGARCEPCDTEDSVLVVGVVVGYYLVAGPDLTFIPADCPDQELAAVMIAGRCRVLVAENVAKDEYVFQSSTDGEAKGDATAAAGAFAIFESIGDSGNLAYVRLFGSVVLGAGGGGGGDGAVVFELVTPTNGMQADVQMPYDGTWTGWTLLADASGSAVVDVWLDDYASYPPDNSDSITGGNEPEISADTDDTGGVSGWTTAFLTGDCVRINVDSVSGITRLTLVLTFTR